MLGPLDLLVPSLVLLTSALTLPFTLLALSLTGRATALTAWPALKHAWFQNFWFWFGPASKPLFLSGVKPVLQDVYGTVLDVGPASGVWMRELGEVARRDPGRIRKVWGVEPNALFHDQLRAAAKRYGLEGVYEPVAAYAGGLEGHGIEKGGVDTIVTVHVLCSVGPPAKQARVVRELYEYLKPGGQWLVFEHVASRHATVRAWQGIYNAVWPTLLDGCDLTRNTDLVLRDAGAWERVDVRPDPRDGYFETLPHTVGKLVKTR